MPKKCARRSKLPPSLRKRAESALRTSLTDLGLMSTEDIHRMVHELQVHQIELEMQNEELRRSQVEQAQTLDRFNALYDFAPAGYLTLDAQGRILEANLVAARMLGVVRADLVGSRLKRFIDRESQDIFYLHQRGLFAGEKSLCCELTLRDAKGTPRPVQLESNQFLDEASQEFRCRTILINITERRLAEAALRESEERYRCIVQTAEEGVLTIDAASLTDFVNPKMAQMLGYTVGEMIGRPLTDFMDEEGRALLAKYLKRRRQGIAEQFEFKFLRKDGSGLWTFISTNPIKDASGAYVGALAMVTDITERKQAEAALEESEEKFRTLFENAGDAIILMQGDRAIDCNARTLEMFGCQSRDQIVGHAAGEFAPVRQPNGRDSRELATGKIAAALSGSRQVFEWTHAKLDGETFPAEVTLNAVQLRDKVLLQAIVRDLTERRKAELAHLSTLALLERTGQIAKVGGWELDLRTMEHIRTLETCRILEIDPTEPASLEQGIDFLVPEARPAMWAAFHAAATSGTPYDLELPLITAKGRRIWVRNQGSAVMENGKAIKLLGAFHDITERKQAEEALARTSELLERTGEMAEVGGWELDLRTMELFWSLETCRIHELDLLVAPTLDESINFYAPEVRSIIQKAVQAGIESGTPWDLELPLITAKGRPIWVRAQGSVVREDGKAIKLIGAIQDITTRKGAQEALAASESALQRANEDLQRSNEDLERRVADRTARLRALTTELTHAEERVRLRVADSLHEGLSQLLSAALMNLASLEPHLKTGTTLRRLKDLQYCLDESINVCRTLTYELSPPILQSLGIGAALKWLESWYHDKYGLSVQVRVARRLDVEDRELRITLFRAASELLFNVLKHAQVEQAWVQFRRMSGGLVRLEVSDTGVGFDPAAVKKREGSTGGFGLFSLRERIEARGGRFEVESTPGRGSRIIITVPVVPPPVSAAAPSVSETESRPNSARPL